MKRMVMICCLMVCYYFPLLAQKSTGCVLDEIKVPVSFANIVVFTLPDSTFICGTITDEQGLFSLESIPRNGIIKISSVGYTTIYHHYNGNDFGTIEMKSDEQLLGEVVIKADLPKTRLKGDALVTNVQNSVLSKVGSANDVLGKVPGIIKKKDVFEVFGKGTPLIYINGRQVRDASELEQLNSNEIKEVQVITNPGARYDASVKAVVRIQTVQRKGDGFGFDMRSSYYQSTNVDLIEQVNMNYRHNGLDVFGTFRYDRSAWTQKNNMKQTLFADTVWTQFNPHIENGVSQALRGTIGINYMINEKHSLGLRYTLIGKPASHNNLKTTSEIYANDTFYDKLESQGINVVKNDPTHQLNLYYNGSVGLLDIDFNGDYYTNHSETTSHTKEQSVEKENRDVNSLGMVENSLLASRLILSYPLWKGNISLGGEYSYTHRQDDYMNEENYVSSSRTLIKEANKNAFIEYNKKFPFGNVALGIRYENVAFDYYEDDKYVDVQSRDFDNWFPSASFSTQIGQIQTLISYTSKTQRPSYRQLSNNVFYVNRFTMQTGNPALKSATIHDLSLSGSWKFFQLMLSYQQKRNAIVFWSDPVLGNSSVTMFKFINMNNIPSMTAFLSASPKIGCWSPQISIGLRKQWFDLISNNKQVKLDKPIFMATLNNTFNLPKDFMFSVDFSYQGKGDNENYSMNKAQYLCNISLLKSFLNETLSIELRGTDLFHQMVYRGQIYTNKAYFYPNNSNDSREFAVTVRYKFNSTKNKYKGTGAANDELKRL